MILTTLLSNKILNKIYTLHKTISDIDITGHLLLCFSNNPTGLIEIEFLHKSTTFQCYYPMVCYDIDISTSINKENSAISTNKGNYTVVTSTSDDKNFKSKNIKDNNRDVRDVKSDKNRYNKDVKDIKSDRNIRDENKRYNRDVRDTKSDRNRYNKTARDDIETIEEEDNIETIEEDNIKSAEANKELKLILSLDSLKFLSLLSYCGDTIKSCNLTIEFLPINEITDINNKNQIKSIKYQFTMLNGYSIESEEILTKEEQEEQISKSEMFIIIPLSELPIPELSMNINVKSVLHILKCLYDVCKEKKKLINFTMESIKHNGNNNGVCTFELDETGPKVKHSSGPSAAVDRSSGPSVTVEHSSGFGVAVEHSSKSMPISLCLPIDGNNKVEIKGIDNNKIEKHKKVSTKFSLSKLIHLLEMIIKNSMSDVYMYFGITTDNPLFITNNLMPSRSDELYILGAFIKE